MEHFVPKMAALALRNSYGAPHDNTRRGIAWQVYDERPPAFVLDAARLVTLLACCQAWITTDARLGCQSQPVRMRRRVVSRSEAQASCEPRLKGPRGIGAEAPRPRPQARSDRALGLSALRPEMTTVGHAAARS